MISPFHTDLQVSLRIAEERSPAPERMSFEETETTCTDLRPRRRRFITQNNPSGGESKIARATGAGRPRHVPKGSTGLFALRGRERGEDGQLCRSIGLGGAAVVP